LNICVAGWYFRPAFLECLARSGYDTFVVKHREDICGLPSKLYPNEGLEFGAYRQYVENHWDGVSDVLFIHDDAELSSVDALADVETLGSLGVEQAYIFPDEIHELVNGGAHGRAIWMRADIIAKLKDDFPADMQNSGVNVGLEAQRGILAFHKRILECGKDTGVIAIVPQFTFGHRGRIHQQMFVYRKTGQVPGGVVNVNE
jgi:hypothetical protein